MEPIDASSGLWIKYGDIRRYLAMNAAVCFFIAVFLTMIRAGGTFNENLVVSFSIGFSIFLLMGVAGYATHRHSPLVKGLGGLLGLSLGSLAGAFIGFNLIGVSSFVTFSNPEWRRTLFLALTFGVVVSWFYYSLLRMAQARESAKEVELKKAHYETQLAQTEVKLLQAQIEPHFLYNTLANIHSLIQSRPQDAATMLENLIGYLRASLDRSRSAQVPLRDEMDLLRAYLDILKVRMGGRLQYTIEISDALASRHFPPMLLQPLVENAVKHGLEPKVGGGKITISASEENGMVQITVADSGVGLGPNGADGFGLGNVRSRLLSLYGDRARLTVSADINGGVCAVITVPKGE